MTGDKKKILIAPLNWGLGHAARCIPIIKALIKQGFEPILASDGDALVLLQKEFPSLISYELPSYDIKYATGKKQKLKLVVQSPQILKASINEQKFVQQIHQQENLSGIISDNRFGVRLASIPSVYITHQIQVLSGNTTAITSKLHQQLIVKFDECWVPDDSNSTLSGVLSKIKNQKLPIKYIGALSRFNKQELPQKYDLLIVLSGPEPQRTILEQKLRVQLKRYDKRVLLVRGVFTKDKIHSNQPNITIANYMLSEALEHAFNESELILARSGYSTILDLSKLGKKAFFIPTPGQFEQEYLAEQLEEKKIAPYSSQEAFELQLLDKIDDYSGFTAIENEFDTNLFNLF